MTLDAPSTRVAGAPALTGKASTGGGDETAVTVRVYPGAAASGLPARTISAAVGAGGAYSAPTAGLTDGTWTAQTVQRDAAGNTGTSVARTFTLDTTAPAVALTTPSDSTFTRDVTPTFAGTAGTAPGDASSVTVPGLRRRDRDGHAGPHAHRPGGGRRRSRSPRARWATAPTRRSPGRPTTSATWAPRRRGRSWSTPWRRR